MKNVLILLTFLTAVCSSVQALGRTNGNVRDYRFTIETEFGAGSVKLSADDKNIMKRLVYEQLGYYLQSLHQRGISAMPEDIIVKSAITVSRTDAAGTAAKNQEVSQRRAMGLDNDMRAIMFNLGVRFSPEVFFYMGVGEEEANEYECEIEVRPCGNQQQQIQLPWDPPVQQCYRETLVCPAHQRRSTIEVILQYAPGVVTTPPVDNKIVTEPLPDITPDKTPSIIEIPETQKQPEDVQPLPENPKVDTPAVVQPLPSPSTTEESAPEADNLPEAEDKPAPEDTKPGPNKLKVYGNEVED